MNEETKTVKIKGFEFLPCPFSGSAVRSLVATTTTSPVLGPLE